MVKATPILASERLAAELLDLPVAEFRGLVQAGHLPHGRQIAPGLVRWPVDDLRRLANGDASDGMSAVQW